VAVHCGHQEGTEQGGGIGILYGMPSSRPASPEFWIWLAISAAMAVLIFICLAMDDTGLPQASGCSNSERVAVPTTAAYCSPKHWNEKGCHHPEGWRQARPLPIRVCVGAGRKAHKPARGL